MNEQLKVTILKFYSLPRYELHKCVLCVKHFRNTITFRPTT